MVTDDPHRLNGILEYKVTYYATAQSIRKQEWPMDELTGWIEPTHIIPPTRTFLAREMEPAPSGKARGRDDGQMRLWY